VKRAAEKFCYQPLKSVLAEEFATSEEGRIWKSEVRNIVDDQA
jgi:hypothetical protein